MRAEGERVRPNSCDYYKVALLRNNNNTGKQAGRKSETETSTPYKTRATCVREYARVCVCVCMSVSVNYHTVVYHALTS